MTHNTDPKHTGPEAKAPSALRRAFDKVKDGVREYASKNRGQTIAIAASIFLGTTALTAPLMATTATAGLVMAGAFYLLAKSSDALIDHSAAAGKKLGFSPLLVGLTLGALTSAPEFFVSLGAIAKGSPELGVGNVVGSNIANILLILGVTAAIKALPKAEGTGWKFNNMAMMGATGLLGAQLLTGFMTPAVGAVMLGLAGAYLVKSALVNKADMAATQTSEPAFSEGHTIHEAEKVPGWLNAIWGGAGLAGLVYAADMLVDSASRFATGIGVSQALVGTLAVAVGTSLPELMVNIKAALKGDAAVGLGNILGSNIFNVLVVGGAVAAAGATVPDSFSPTTLPGALNLAAFGGSAALLGRTLIKNGGAISRKEGIAAMGLYAAFVAASMMVDGGASAPAVAVDAALPALSAPAP